MKTGWLLKQVSLRTSSSLLSQVLLLWDLASLPRRFFGLKRIVRTAEGTEENFCPQL
jgi:hypothetical protein